MNAAASDQAAEAVKSVAYELSQQDVSNLISLATTLSVELWLIIAFLVLISGLLFGSIATRFWKVG